MVGTKSREASGRISAMKRPVIVRRRFRRFDTAVTQDCSLNRQRSEEEVRGFRLNNYDALGKMDQQGHPDSEGRTADIAVLPR